MKCPLCGRNDFFFIYNKCRFSLFDGSISTSSNSDDIIEDNVSLASNNEIINPKDEKKDIFEMNDIGLSFQQIIISQTKEDDSTKTKPNFITKKKEQKDFKKKRGREKKKDIERIEHDSNSYDNIITKIQVHFLNFLISFLNDAIDSIFEKNKNIHFVKFNYAEKSNRKNEYLAKMKSSTIKDLLLNIDISRKYKKFEKNINKKLVEKLDQFPFFQQVFKMNFLKLFYYYYNNKQPFEQKLLIFDQVIILSEKTKSFYNLLDKNQELEENIMNVIKFDYLEKMDQMI